MNITQIILVVVFIVVTIIGYLLINHVQACFILLNVGNECFIGDYRSWCFNPLLL